MSQLNFSRDGWTEFYGIPQFGSIRKAYPSLATKIPALQRACRFLVVQPLTENRLGAVLHTTGTQHVIGFGMNLISKVLTVSDRRQ